MRIDQVSELIREGECSEGRIPESRMGESMRQEYCVQSQQPSVAGIPKSSRLQEMRVDPKNESLEGKSGKNSDRRSW
jgi:hypothetical protein